MATYKVIQNIEAEDHIIGPFSFRQFVYLLICAFFLYINFVLLTKGLALFMIIFLPPALFFGFLAFPFTKDQPTEVWALAKINFLVKPRKRLWNQQGLKELVVITAPVNNIAPLTDGLNQHEIKNRLKALSETIDSRGWAIKNITNNQALSYQPDDRLINPDSLPKAVPDYPIEDSLDILDNNSSSVSITMEEKINKSTYDHRQRIIDSMKAVATDQDKNDELLAQITSQKSASRDTTSKLHTINLDSFKTNEQIDDTPVTVTNENILQNQQATVKPVVTPVSSSVILNLSGNNDLNLSTLSKEASKHIDSTNDEVVISLH